MLRLVLIAAACATLLAFTDACTADRITGNARAYEHRQITDLAGAAPPPGTMWTDDVWDFCNGTQLARGWAAGYGGPIRLVVGVSAGRILGIRVTDHQETPGLADFLRRPERGWLAGFSGRARPEAMAVDALAGATITSEAVIQAVRRAMARADEVTIDRCRA
ncbi:MAG: FMN-binding protein [Pseudomonadales bacterium]|nr:FMN-binding protein [Pseudomonadales bacterium]NIX06525.1 FMN-binding protein [Pseudomonadales bacterium]